MWEEEEEICRREREEERWLFQACEWWSCRHWSGVRRMKMFVEEMMVRVGCDGRKKKLAEEKERGVRGGVIVHRDGMGWRRKLGCYYSRWC